MNIPAPHSRATHPTPSVERCIARHDGGYLVRLSSGQTGISQTALALGAPAIRNASGAVETVR